MNCSTTSCLSTIITTVLDTYLFQALQLQNNTVCLVWDDLDFEPEFSLAGQYVILRSSDSKYLNDAIAKSFCERYVLFGNIITPFLNTFVRSIIEVNWRAPENVMILVAETFNKEILSHRIVKEIPDILFLKLKDCPYVEAYTSRFLSLYTDVPEELYLLDTFNGSAFQESVNLFPNKRQNLHGRIVRLGLFDYLPFTVLSKMTGAGNAWINNSGNIENYYLDGLEGRVLTTYCEIFNCSIEILRLEYGQWGQIYSNLSGDGQVGLVVDNKADIAFNSFYGWDDIYPYCGMSRFVSHSRVNFLVPGPKIIDSWLLPVQPFSSTVWIAVVICFSLEVISIGFVQLQYSEVLIGAHRLLNSFYIGIMSTYRIHVSQNVPQALEQTSKRIIFFSCFMIDLIIAGAYSGSLAAILTLTSFSDVADTIPKMISFGLEWGAISDDWILSLEDSDEPKIKDLLKLYHLYTIDEMKELASKGKVGIIFEQLSYGLISTPEFINRENSKLYVISSEEAYSGFTVSFVSKAWPHLKNYNKIIAMIQESGLQKVWERQVGEKYMDNVIQRTLLDSKKSRGTNEPIPLGMTNFSGIIIIWCFGIILSIVVFLIEIFMRKKKLQNH